ncbi:MAG: beta-galactosidase, partial [Defluviitaleaceae bacterium]|nr:beta-galactosidase [Defluviitaleaceae bacterium]
MKINDYQSYNKDERILHGGDYNPDQWLNYPDILADDIRFMQMSGCNTFSVGIFAWAALEPAEGQYSFGWLDKIMDDIASIGGNVFLATPTGARPAWMSQKYPEVLRVNARREKALHGRRHNHCYTSPVYREKTTAMNRALAERYKDHPALMMWHISNEYSGDCHCDLCQEAFRGWLKDKYQNLDALNHAWWAPFWSHTYTCWSQIDSPSPLGEDGLHGHNLDWKRFVNYQTMNFYEHEIAPLREISPHIPCTTNFMGQMGQPQDAYPFPGLDYAKFAKKVDIVTWDAYPLWHNDFETAAHTAAKQALICDFFRALKNAPFLTMECTPSLVNWQFINRAKRPGAHILSALSLLAHGSDSILYFQWRMSRGSFEKFHGAVVAHDNSAENRVFKEVARLSEILDNIKEIKGATTPARVGLIFDQENKWALDDAAAFNWKDKKYSKTVYAHHHAFWRRNIPVDVIPPCADFSRYDLVIAPMQYMLGADLMGRMKEYVKNGGKLVTTYISGLVDETDLAHLGWPAELEEIFGIRLLETDSLHPNQTTGFTALGRDYAAVDYCAVIEAAGAKILGKYTSDFYADTPAITENRLGSGAAYFIAPRTD